MVSRKNLKIDFGKAHDKTAHPGQKSDAVAELVGCRIKREANPSMPFKGANAIVTEPAGFPRHMIQTAR